MINTNHIALLEIFSLRLLYLHLHGFGYILSMMKVIFVIT